MHRTSAQKRMVEADSASPCPPESSVDEELRARTLRVLNVPSARVTIPIVLVHRRRAYLGAAARTLIADLVAWPGHTAQPAARSRRKR